MAKLILLGIALFTSIMPLVVPLRANPQRAVRRIQILTAVGVFVWAYACRVWYPQLVHVE